MGQRKDYQKDSKKVFVVHGRDESSRRACFDFLRALGLSPLEWSHAVRESQKGSPYVGEVLENAFETAQAVVVLLTGDDLSQLRPDLLHDDDEEFEANLTPQARPNVLFEAGMAFGRCPERTVIIQIGSLRPFSDIAGRHIVRFSGDLHSRQELGSRLKTAGCAVDMGGTDWHSAGDFGSNTQRVAQSLPRDHEKEEVEEQLSKEELAVLMSLVERENWGSLGGASTQTIAFATRLSLARTRHHLDVLEEKKLVQATLHVSSPISYSLTRKGRQKLVELNKV